MTKTFLIGDTHFGHNNILSFERETWKDFNDIDERDDYIVEQWNSVVSPGDRVYHLGDVAMPRSSVHRLGELNGRIKLISGNHDEQTYGLLSKYVDQIAGAKKMGNDVLLTHFPIHPQQLDHGRVRANIHAHMHEHTIENDPRYYSVSINQLEGHKPIEWNDLLNKLEDLNND